MNRKHILHITYDMHIGGTEQVIRNLVEGLDSQRFHSSILCIDGTIGPWGQALHQKGFSHFCLKRQPGFDLRLIADIRSLIQRERFDIIHCHQYTPYTYGWFGSLLTGKPVIFTEHGRFYPDTSSLKRRILNPLLEKRTAAITAISAATKLALVNFENLTESRIDVIYNGIADLQRDPPFGLRESLKLPQDAVIFGTISRLDPIKNQAMMLRAFKAVHSSHPNARLLIVGDGPLRSELEDLTRSLELGDSVIFTGFKPTPQEFLALMDVFLLPSLSEGTSMTLLEAMSFAKPSIATSVGGTPEILTDQKTGLLIPNKDEAALAAAMHTLAASKGLRDSFGHAAREDYEKRFTLPAMTERYEALYERISQK